jgi:diacylglycerol kinase (ATP)
LNIQKVHVIINPASGQDEAVLNRLNTVFNETGIAWDIAVTHKSGDALAAARGVIGSDYDALLVYGGDDTIAEAAAGLHGSNIPLAILPGGTANVMATELGIPRVLDQALALLHDGTTRCVDLGRAGDRLFTVRLSTGLLAEMVLRPDREAKDRFGELAYALAGLQALSEPNEAQYEITIDGSTETISGVACLVANSGNLALEDVSFSPDIRVDDGLLDVIVIRRADLSSIVSIAASAARLESIGEPLPHWQGREITVRAEPPQTVAIDGEDMGKTPISAAIVPASIRVFVPKDAQQGGEDV